MGRAGRLDTRATISAPGPTGSTTDPDVADVWVDLEPLRGEEAVRMGIQDSSVVYRGKMRYNAYPTLSAENWLTALGKRLDIKAPYFDGTREWIHFMAVERRGG